MIVHIHHIDMHINTFASKHVHIVPTRNPLLLSGRGGLRSHINRMHIACLPDKLDSTLRTAVGRTSPFIDLGIGFGTQSLRKPLLGYG